MNIIWAALIPRAPPPSAVFSLFSDDTGFGQNLSAHVDKVRAVFERMDHTFNMARARSDLRATINGFCQKSERDENACPPLDTGSVEIESKEVSSRLRTQRRKTRVRS